MKAELETMCREEGISFESHDSHGYYLDVTARGKRLMIDPFPESVWRDGKLAKRWPKGMLLVRDGTHHYDRPTHLASFDMSKPGWLAELRALLTRPTLAGLQSVNSITGELL